MRITRTNPPTLTLPTRAGESHMKNRILEAKSSIPLLRRPASPDSKIAVRSRFRFENFSASCAQVFEIPYAIALPQGGGRHEDESLNTINNKPERCARIAPVFSCHASDYSVT